MMKTIEQTLYHYGIVPVIALEDISIAKDLAIALTQGGLAIAEVTYRSDCAHDVIKVMKKACPEMMIGAGTILCKEQVDSAIDAGAQFIVTPGLNPEIVTYCITKGITIIPGCATPSDIERALSLGITTVKFFPAEINGGIQAIKAMAAPYRSIRFMPTGGINKDNLATYLSDPHVLACGGTWMVTKQLLETRNFEQITSLSKQAVQAMLDIKLAHVGINIDTEHYEMTKQMATFAQTNIEQIDDTTWIGKEIALTKMSDQSIGKLTYSSKQIERARFFLEQAGVQFDEESIKKDKQGNMISVYALKKVHGFALQLIQEGI